MLSARACMQDPNFDIKVSAQTILDCYPSGAGCLAPSYEAALAMLASQPIPDEQCNPLDAFPGEGYVAAPGDCEADLCHGAPRYKVDPATVSHVVASFAPDAAKVDGAEDSGAWVLRSGGEPALPISVQPLMEAVARGPVLGTVNVYFSSDRAIRLSPSERPISPFANLRKPVFDGPGKVADADKPDATHAVMVLGWGESDGARYWLVQDAVGRCFGDEGTFRVRMGANVLNLEAYGFWAADLDLEQALQDRAVAEFVAGCAPVVEARGACANGGVLSQNGCACVCSGSWTGARCETCAVRCANGGVTQDYVLEGGTAHTSKCRCDCPEGFEGEHCETACPAASRIILAVN